MLRAMYCPVSGPILAAVVLTCLTANGHGASDSTPSATPAAVSTPTPTPATGAHAPTEP